MMGMYLYIPYCLHPSQKFGHAIRPVTLRKIRVKFGGLKSEDIDCPSDTMARGTQKFTIRDPRNFMVVKETMLKVKKGSIVKEHKQLSKLLLDAGRALTKEGKKQQKELKEYKHKKAGRSKSGKRRE